MRTDASDLMIAKRLLDQLKLCGFHFRRAGPGVDGPLMGHRVIGDWADMIHIEGFRCNCFAWRQRTSALIVPGSALVQRQVEGSALSVFNEVLGWETGDDGLSVPPTGKDPEPIGHCPTRSPAGRRSSVDPA